MKIYATRILTCLALTALPQLAWSQTPAANNAPVAAPVAAPLTAAGSGNQRVRCHAATGAALVEKRLDHLRRQRDPRRTAVDDAAERRAMAFAPGGDAEQVTEGVVRHGAASSGNEIGRAHV